MATMEDLRPDEVALLKGRPHPLYKGVLRLGFENGLRELSVKVVQFPSPENGNLAVCEATAVFGREGGQDMVFTEVGDCDDKNCGPQIAIHKVRMAATRAKGRALRDGLGIGVALKEEMADEVVSAAETVCARRGCGAVLTQQEIENSKKNERLFGGKLYCDADAREAWERISASQKARVPAGQVG